MLKIPLFSIHGLELRVPNWYIGLPSGLRLCENIKKSLKTVWGEQREIEKCVRCCVDAFTLLLCTFRHSRYRLAHVFCGSFFAAQLLTYIN